MESDYAAGLYRFLGLSVGAEFSAADVALLYRKVFHLRSSSDEARAAMRKAALGGKNWLCVGRNVLDVLLEMEREREKQEKLYWHIQLLSAGTQPTPVDADKLFSICSAARDCVYDMPELSSWESTHKPQDSGCKRSGALDGAQLEVEERELGVVRKAARKLEKAARHSWARVASEGVRSTLRPCRRRGPGPEVRGQAWGRVSPSDVLLMLDVKFDAVTQRLYAEMLQQHHTLTHWQSLLPWQQRQEEEELEDLAEEALESADALRLAELPGAFTVYRAASFSSGSEPEEQSWSAASMLCDLHTIRRREKEEVSLLAERLDEENLQLLCLHVKLATVRARREKTSYGALLAARQSWETWPQVRSPCRADEAAWWLLSRDLQQHEDWASAPPAQSPLQQLVKIQEQERTQLLQCLRGVTLQDLQGPHPKAPPGTDDLRNGCLQKLRRIHADWLQQKGAQEPPVHPHELNTQPSDEQRSKQQVALCSLLLLEELMGRQDVRASALMHKHGQTLREDPDSELDTLQLLLADSCGIVASPPSISPDPTSCGGATSAGAGDCELVEVVTLNPEPSPSRDPHGEGGGEPAEVLPYLEITCRLEETGHEPLRPFKEGGVGLEQDDTLEKQGSLIALAWSKRPNEAEEAEEGLTSRTQESITSAAVEGEEMAAQADREALTPATVQPEAQPAVEPWRASTETREDCNLAVHVLAAEALQGLSADPPPGAQRGNDNVTDLCSAPLVMELELLPAGREPQEKEEDEEEEVLGSPAAENRKRTAGAEVDGSCKELSLMEPVSAMERERTMRNLVNVQRKVERRQQRGRERQLLRVQERLSIVQNRKAEEDLLGLTLEDKLRHLTQDLPQEDKSQQKTVVRERLELLRRERSNVLQSKRDRNTAGFKELLGPVAPHRSEAGDERD